MKRIIWFPALFTLVGAACGNPAPNPFGTTSAGGSDPSGGGVVVTSVGSSMTGGTGGLGATGSSATGAGGAGGAGGTGGTGGSSFTTSVTTTSAATTSGSATTTTSAATGTGGGAPVCSGILTAGDCATCLEGSCCAELANCDAVTGCLDCVTGTATACDPTNKNAVDGFNACVTASCDTVCAAPAPPDATCSVPVPSPSAGACVTLNADILCNPVTNAACDTAAGEACDFGGTAFKCYPAPNTINLCQACDATNGPFCKGGETCDNGVCAKFCCTNADCGAGMCDKTGMFPGGAGECIGGN
jgi:hypothetical protein